MSVLSSECDGATEWKVVGGDWKIIEGEANVGHRKKIE